MKRELETVLAAVGQSHVLQFWEQLDEAGKNRLAGQIQSIDFESLQALIEGRDSTADLSDRIAKATAPPAFRLGVEHPTISRDAARTRGEEIIAANQLGMILVAGGQGTRLGFDHPKGMFPIGPISGRTLFQVLVERLTAIARRHNARVPLFLMTSPATHDETMAFFERNHRFGLDESDLHIFCQGVMPAVDAVTGRVLMSAKDSLALSPDGHGGMLPALVASGGLDMAANRGIEHFFYGQVDNPLTPIGDPELIGFHALSQSELTTQVVRKRDPLERVGNVVSVDGQLQIIEYSELPTSAADKRDEHGEPIFWAGNIAVHLFQLEFLKRASASAAALPIHRARKTTSHIDAYGNFITPESLNALKFERFIFDLLPLARNSVVVEVDPADAFAPVKNADTEASDTPRTSRAAMLRQHRDLLLAAGADVDEDAAVEISPLYALDSEELQAKLPPGARMTGKMFLKAE